MSSGSRGHQVPRTWPKLSNKPGSDNPTGYSVIGILGDPSRGKIYYTRLNEIAPLCPEKNAAISFSWRDFV